MEMNDAIVFNGVGCSALLQRIFQTQGLTQVSHIAGGFFTIWTTREALVEMYIHIEEQECN